MTPLFIGALAAGFLLALYVRVALDRPLYLVLRDIRRKPP